MNSSLPPVRDRCPHCGAGRSPAAEQCWMCYRAYNEEVIFIADDKVLFMHCLPAYRGEEISENLLDDPRSCVWQEAENRLHAQKALMEFLFSSANALPELTPVYR